MEHSPLAIRSSPQKPRTPSPSPIDGQQEPRQCLRCKEFRLPDSFLTKNNKAVQRCATCCRKPEPVPNRKRSIERLSSTPVKSPTDRRGRRQPRFTNATVASDGRLQVPNGNRRSPRRSPHRYRRGINSQDSPRMQRQREQNVMNYPVGLHIYTHGSKTG
jgi:hypothetical protein